MKEIRIRGARTHNLKAVNVDLPRDKLVVITGLSGSGKSSLAFDTLYAEGQRRYVESLSAYARQFLSMMEKPDVEHIAGLSPAISIEQKATSHNPRSTVGTVTEIYDYLRLLYARVGIPHCPEHETVLDAQTVSQMVDTVLNFEEGTQIMVLAPVVRARKGEHQQLLKALIAQGFIRARIDGSVYELEDVPPLDRKRKHTIEVMVDRVKVRASVRLRLSESFETALRLTDGLVTVSFLDADQNDLVFSSTFSCSECGFSIPKLEPRLFSFNNPVGACTLCNGLGIEQFFDPKKIVHNPEHSLSEGAIRGWDRRHLFYYQMMASLAEHYGFALDKPFRTLSKTVKDVLLYGSGQEAIAFTFINERGHKTKRTYPFEGVVSHMERRYHETDSMQVREDLAKYLTVSVCKTCEGTRLCRPARFVRVNGRALPELVELSIREVHQFFKQMKLTGWRGEVAQKILKEVCSRLHFLESVGLDYLSLSRSAETLSGGEAQRIRLASQIGSGLVGVMYILDEPSIGLHQRDNTRLLSTLTHLRDLGNTVIVVEHDEEAIRAADYLVDMGPGAGVHGGTVVAEGSVKDLAQVPESLTGQYLSGQRCIEVPKQRTPFNSKKVLSLKGARCNNLKRVDVEVPVGLMTCITGVSGSGKSSLINDTLYPLAAIELNRATQLTTGPYQSIEGLEWVQKVVDIDQSPIGRTPRSNPATYTGVFTPIRELFSMTEESRSRGYKPGRFSFNVKGGRCEACQGDGVSRVEMHFLADMYVTCDVCEGRRYNEETLQVRYKGKSIHEVLQMTVEDAREFFDAVPLVARKLQTLLDVGLAYVQLGQSATTLSGGEAQRVKLSRELSRRDTGDTLYILDEPTTGLHFEDIKQLLVVLHRLRDHGNTVVVIEHNLDVIKTADWIIDLGPEGGSGGGRVIAVGTPETVAKSKLSHTGHFLKGLL